MATPDDFELNRPVPLGQKLGGAGGGPPVVPIALVAALVVAVIGGGAWWLSRAPEAPPSNNTSAVLATEASVAPPAAPAVEFRDLPVDQLPVSAGICTNKISGEMPSPGLENLRSMPCI